MRVKGFESIDIVIVNYKSARCLKLCLESIKKTSKNINVNIFVEDNSAEWELQEIKVTFPNITITTHGSNLGFAKAANKGGKKGNSAYLIVLNPDTVILRGFFHSVLTFMEENPKVGILGPKMLNVDGSIQGSARSFPTPLTAFFGRSSMLTKLFPNNRFTRQNLLTMSSDGISSMEVDWVSGACMVIRRKALEHVGMFDEQFFMYWEDADLCKRMRDRGWKVVYFPSASIIHYAGASSSHEIFKCLLEFHKSGYRLFCKYLVRKREVTKFAAAFVLALRFFSVLPLSLFRACLIEKKEKRRGRNPKRGFSSPRRIRILRVVSRLNIGGPAIHVALLTKGLNSKRFQNYLVTGTPSPHEGDMSYLFRDYNNEIFVLPTLHREIDLITDFRTVISLYRLMRRIRPHIVDSHTAKAGFTTRIAASCLRLFSKNGPLMVHTFHGNVFKGYFRKSKSLAYIGIERVLARLTDVIIAISPAQKEELVHTYRIASDEKVKVVPLGLELDRFFTCDKLRGQFKCEFSINKDSFLVGIVGRLVPIKNHVMFLKAAKMFVSEHPDINVRFAVVGDGELREELESLTRKMGLREKVRFCGWIKDVQNVYADLDVLVLTSINEGTPVSIIEAMASKVPVISTCVGGVRDLIGISKEDIESGDFAVCSRGILCNSGDSLGLARALEYLLREDKEEKEKRLMTALEFVKERYSKARLLSDMESLYTDLLKKTHY